MERGSEEAHVFVSSAERRKDGGNEEARASVAERSKKRIDTQEFAESKAVSAGDSRKATRGNGDGSPLAAVAAARRARKQAEQNDGFAFSSTAGVTADGEETLASEREAEAREQNCYGLSSAKPQGAQAPSRILSAMENN
jgi:hypothetical protein